VQALPSSQDEPVRHCHVPPTLVQRYVVPPQLTDRQLTWVAALQVDVVPPPHAPFAPLGPHPEQVRPVVSVLLEQASAHVPLAVLQPAAAPHAAVQHWLVGPAAQVVEIGVQLHGLHVPVPLQVLEQDAG
jgi:hypothetical protein